MSDKKTAQSTIDENKDLINEQYQRLLVNANELLEEGKKQAAEFNDIIKEYGDELSKNVQKNPVTSLLVAGGVGFILSALLKK